MPYMKYVLLALMLSIFCPSKAIQAKPVGTSPDSIPVKLPVGVLVEYKVTTSNKSSIPVISYYDEGQNSVHITKVSSGWTLSFRTTRPNQHLMVLCNAKAHSNWYNYVPGPVKMAVKDHPTITATISINGEVKKQATGDGVNLLYVYPY